jgi:membrane protein
VAFFGFVALFPGLVAAVLVYGLVADPTDVRRQIDALSAALPAEAESVLTEQMQAIASTPDRALGLGLAKRCWWRCGAPPRESVD